MMGREQWYADAHGRLLATDHGLRLIIRQFDGCARYLVTQIAPLGEKYGDTLLASGTESNVEAAMAAARRTACRIAPTLARRAKIMAPANETDRIGGFQNEVTNG